MLKGQKYLEKMERDKRKALLKNSQENEKEKDEKEEEENKEEKDEEENFGEKNKDGDASQKNNKDAVKNTKKKEPKDLIRITIREYQSLRAMEIKSELLN